MHDLLAIDMEICHIVKCNSQNIKVLCKRDCNSKLAMSYAFSQSNFAF